MNSQPHIKQENEEFGAKKAMELVEYERIIKFAEDLLAGKHPRVKITAAKV